MRYGSRADHFSITVNIIFIYLFMYNFKIYVYNYKSEILLLTQLTNNRTVHVILDTQ